MEDQLFNKLKKEAASTMHTMLLLIFIMCFLLIAVLLSYFDVIHIVELNPGNKRLLLIFTIVLSAGSLVGAVITMVPFYLDYRMVRNKAYEVQTVTVSRFDFYWSGYEPLERIWFPVFEDVNSGKILKIEVDEKVEVGEIFSIVHLHRTKITVLKKRNNFTVILFFTALGNRCGFFCL